MQRKAVPPMLLCKCIFKQICRLSFIVSACTMVLASLWDCCATDHVSLAVSPGSSIFEGGFFVLKCVPIESASNWSVYRNTSHRPEPRTCGKTWGRPLNDRCKVGLAATWDSGDYWCQSTEGAVSPVVIVRVSSGDLLVLLPSLPVSLGEDVTLRCLNRSRSPVSALFHRGDLLLSSEPSTDLSLRAVSLDDQGWYRCSHGAMKSPQVLLQVLNRSVTVGESKVPPWVPPTTSSSDPSPTQLLLRLVRHLLVCCPYCMSTVLMVSLYRQKHKENKRPRLRKPKRECEDTAADVTTEYQFGEV